MKKLNSYLIIFLLLSTVLFSMPFSPVVNIAIAPSNNWTINGNTVYVNDSLVYASATPHTISGSGDVVFEFKSKVFTGNVDFIFGFDQQVMRPTAIWLWQNYSHPYNVMKYNQDWGSVTLNSVTGFTSLGIQNYDLYTVTLGNKNNTYLYQVSYGGNKTGIYAFTTYSKVGSTYTISGNYSHWVNEVHSSTYQDWKTFTTPYTKQTFDYGGMNIWYLYQNQPIVSGVTYKIKIRIEQVFGISKLSGKYWFAFKPSSETLGQAIGNNHLYALDPWFNTSWLYCKRIVIDHTKVKSTFTNFPILFDNTSLSFKNHAQNDGDDFVFVKPDNVTKYNHEIESYNHTNGHLVAWVNITNLSSVTDTVMYLYYGNPTCSNQQHITDTWNGGYKAVFHINEGGTMDRNDSTIGGRDLYTNGYTGDEKVVGVAGDADRLNGASMEWLQNDDLTHYLDSDDGTYEIWFYAHSSVGVDGLISKTEDSHGGWTLYKSTAAVKAAYWTGVWKELEPTHSFSNNVWYYIAQTRGTDGYYLYKQGAEYASNAGITNAFAEQVAAVGSLAVGIYNSNPSSGYFDGVVDEVRVSLVQRSPQWINTTYNTIYYKSTFLSVGNEATPSNATVPPTVTTNSATSITSTSATLNGQQTGATISAGFQYGTTTSYGNDININGTSNLIYAGGSTTQKVRKYISSNLSYVTNGTGTSSDYGGAIRAMINDSTYIYVVGATTQKVYQYWKNNLTKKAESAGYGGDLNAIAQDSTYLYIGGETTQKVYQLWKSNLTKKAETVAYGGTIRAICVDSSNVYVGGNTIFRVRKYQISNMAYVSQSASTGVIIYSMAQNNSNIFIGLGNHVIFELRKSDLSKVGETVGYGGVIYTIATDNTFLYIGGEVTQKVAKFWISNLTRVNQNSSDYGGIIYSIVLDNSYVYVGGATTQKIRKYLRTNLSYVTDGTGTSSDYGGLLKSILVGGTTTTLSNNYSYSLTSLTPGTRYHYRAKASNIYGTGYGADAEFITKPNNPTALSVTDTASGQQTLSWTHGTGYNRSVVRGTIGSYPSNPQDGTAIYNNTGNSVVRNGLTAGDDWYYRVWEYTYYGSNFTFSDSYSESHLAVHNISVVVTNSTTGILNTNATLHGFLASNGALTTTCGFWYDTDSGLPYANNHSVGVVADHTTFSYNAPLTVSTHYYVRAWSYNSLGFVYGAEVEFMTKPNNPTALSITDTASGQQTLTWTHGTGYNRSVVRGTIGSYPSNPQDGTAIYNNTGNSVVRNGLTAGDDWYYRVWEYTYYGSNFTFSDSYSESHLAVHNISVVVTNSTTGILNTNATLHGFLASNGALTTTCGFWYDTDSGLPYANNHSVGVVADHTTFSYNAPLTVSTHYYVRAWSYNSLGFVYGAEVEFMTKPNEPTGLNAILQSSTRISLTWTKGVGADTTKILRKTTGYPTDYNDGTSIYNSTGAIYNNTGLTPGQIYYYRAWSYASSTGLFRYSDLYSSDVELTYPEAPTNTSLTLLSPTTLGLTWVKGTGALTTVVLKKNTGLPTSISDGTIVYNGTLTHFNDTLVPGVAAYYKAWSYVNGSTLFRFSANGTEFANASGLIITAFSEDDCSNLSGYSILVSNSDGSQVYVLNNCSHSISINSSLCPQGNDISILVFKNGYRNRIYYLDIGSGLFYYLNAYLPLNTTSELYMITVVGDKNEYGNSPPIDHVFVTIKTYVACTGQYEVVTNIYTDAYGQCDMYLRSTQYKVIMEKTGYVTASEDYIPEVSLRTRTFKLSLIKPSEQVTQYLFKNITYSITPKGQIHHGSFTIWWNISSSDNQLEWFSLDVTKYNPATGLWDTIYHSLVNTTSGGSITFTVPNVTGRYAAEFYFKKIGYPAYKMVELGSISYSIEKIKQALVSIPDYAYYIAILVIMAICMGFIMPYAGIGTGYVGLAIFAIALLLKPINIVMSGDDPTDTVSGWWIWGVTFVMYTVGIFLWSRL